MLDGEYDAALLAAAGVTRLGLATHVTEWIPADAMLPAPGQGALAVQCRTGDTETLRRLAAIDEPEVRAAVEAERAFLQHLGGGCSAPIAAYARVEKGVLRMTGVVASPDGRRIVRVEGEAADGRVDWRGAAMVGRVLLGLALVSCASATPPPGWGPGELDLERRCQQGTGAACGELGAAARRQRRENEGIERGMVLLGIGCGQGDSGVHGAWPEVRNEVQRRGARPRALELLSRACGQRGPPAVRGWVRSAGGRAGRQTGGPRSAADGLSARDARGCELLAQAHAGSEFGNRSSRPGIFRARLRARPANPVAIPGARPDREWREEGSAGPPWSTAAGRDFRRVALSPPTARAAAEPAPDCDRAAPLASTLAPRDATLRDRGRLRREDRDRRPAARLRIACEAERAWRVSTGGMPRRARAEPPGRANARTWCLQSDVDGISDRVRACRRSRSGGGENPEKAERSLTCCGALASRFGDACCALAGAHESGKWVPADPGTHPSCARRPAASATSPAARAAARRNPSSDSGRRSGCACCWSCCLPRAVVRAWNCRLWRRPGRGQGAGADHLAGQQSQLRRGGADGGADLLWGVRWAGERAARAPGRHARARHASRSHRRGRACARPDRRQADGAHARGRRAGAGAGRGRHPGHPGVARQSHRDAGAWEARWEDGHYVVAVGLDDRNLYVMDPSVRGSYGFIPRAELLRRWHDFEIVGGRRVDTTGLASSSAASRLPPLPRSAGAGRVTDQLQQVLGLDLEIAVDDRRRQSAAGGRAAPARRRS